jgi:hypothetical protein
MWAPPMVVILYRSSWISQLCAEAYIGARFDFARGNRRVQRIQFSDLTGGEVLEFAFHAHAHFHGCDW